MKRRAISNIPNAHGARVFVASVVAASFVSLASTRAEAAQSATPFPDESADPNEIAPGAPPPAVAPNAPNAPNAPSTKTAEATSPDEARESEAPTRFGDKGGIVLTGETDLSGGSTAYSHSDATSSALSFNPSFDYFFADNVSLGVVLPLSYSKSTAYGADGSMTRYESTSLGVGARLGYNAVISERFSFYMLAALGGSTQSYDEELVSAAPGKTTTPASNTFSQAGFWVELNAPLLFHVTPHVFAGLGPHLHQDLTRSMVNSQSPDNLRTTIGASLSVGGWF